jgi:hypothetical protein
MDDITKRLRQTRADMIGTDDERHYWDDAAAEIERLRQERNHWMAAARAFDDHLATMRVMMMEHPTVRFSEPRY